MWIQNPESYIQPSHRNQQHHMWRHIPFLFMVEVAISKYKWGMKKHTKLKVAHLHCQGHPKHWKHNKERSVCNKECLRATEPSQGSSFVCCVDADKSAFRVKRWCHASSTKGFHFVMVNLKQGRNWRYVTI